MAAERIEPPDISAPEASKLTTFQRFKRTLLSALELPDGYGRRGRPTLQVTSVKSNSTSDVGNDGKKGDGPHHQLKPSDGPAGSSGKTEDHGDGKDVKDGRKKGFFGKLFSSS